MVTLYEKAVTLTVTGAEGELSAISEELSFRASGYAYSPSYMKFVVTKGKEGWDGWVRPFKIISKTSAVIPRGRKADVLDACMTLGFKVDTDNCLESAHAGLTLDDVPADCLAGGLVLDDSQRQNILGWLQDGMGIHKVTVGGGKTATFGGAIFMLKDKFPKMKIIYITQSERLVRQCVEALRAFLPQFKIGQFGGGKHESDVDDIVVCTTAMLGKHYVKLVSTRWFTQFDAVLFDEVHHAASPTSQKVLLAIPAFYRLGATDSANEDDPSKYNSIRGSFGPYIHTVRAKKLIEIGRLATPHIHIVQHKEWINRFENVPQTAVPGSSCFVLSDGNWIKGTYRGPVYEFDDLGKPVYSYTKVERDEDSDKEDAIKRTKVQKTVNGLHRIQLNGEEQIREVDSKWCLLNRLYDKAVISFGERNKEIVEWAKAFSSVGRRTVIVCTRTLHVYLLESLLLDAVQNVEVMIGTASSAERDRVFDWIKRTPGAVLVTPLVKEGVSINELDAGIVADYVADHEAANQIIGRFIRPKAAGDNRADVVWFRDVQHPSTRRSCNKLFKQLSLIEGYRFYDPAPTPQEWLQARSSSATSARRSRGPRAGS